MNTRAIVFFALAAFAVPSYASSDWTWRHPLPQGNTLYDIVFLDPTTAVAVGEIGTVLVTHDTGNSWLVQNKVNGLDTSLKAIDRLDDNTAVAVGDNGIILRTDDQGASWAMMPSGTSTSLLDVSFFDANNGIVVAGTTVLRTGNGGMTWLSANSPLTLRSVDMISATDALAVGEMTVVKTTDGGSTWISLPPIFLVPEEAAMLTGIDFLDPLHGVIAAASAPNDGYNNNTVGAQCYVTADGGNTWTWSSIPFLASDFDVEPQEVQYSPSGRILTAIRLECCHHQYDYSDPWPTGGFSGVTADGPWPPRFINRAAYGLAQNSAGVVIVVGDEGSIIRRNLDATYTELGPGQPHLRISGSSFVNANTGIVFSSSGEDYHYFEVYNPTHFSRTNDGGQTWSNSTATGACLDVAFLSPTELIAVGIYGTSGLVLRSINGGATWTNIALLYSPHILSSVAAGSATHAVAVGTGIWETGVIIENGVVTPLPIGGYGPFNDVAFASTSVVMAVSPVWRSIDGGLTWTPTGSTGPDRALDFATATRAFGINAGGILRSDDTGDTWTPVPSGAAGGLRDISFSDADHGMAVGDDGLVLMTSDGGNTWASLVTPTTRGLINVSMVVPGRAFVSGFQHFVLEYGMHPVPTLFRSLDIAARPFGADLRWDVTIDENLSGFSIRRTSGGEQTTIASNLAITARSYRDEGLVPGQSYEYQLIAVERDGSFTQSAPVRVTIPAARVELLPNQPNPFNPVTTIRFVVPEKMNVQLTIHDVAGRTVATLVDGPRDAGMQSIEWSADGMASGVYFARLRAGKTEVSQKLVLLK